ncbi:hypothetical protein GGP41_005971 [Bipolaris sorokiniana]|uniref:Uncharacterized protein n=1 Tax=Cochliobolus sativus TaxID=45130 RepID=A0A8H5ZJ70_COCSA|nr:hypothetical protein GGP41_005971 [Bipolaris sorokiniana]
MSSSWVSGCGKIVLIGDDAYEERNIAISILRGGCTATEVVAIFLRALSTITRLHQKFNTTSTIVDRPRSGQLQILLRLSFAKHAVRLKLSINSYLKLRLLCNLTAPVYPPLMLRRLNIVKYLCKKCLKLTLKYARKRLRFTIRYRSFP